MFLTRHLRRQRRGCRFVSTASSLDFHHPEHNQQLQFNNNDGNSGPQWTRTIHRLCSVDGNVDEALRLLDRLRRLHGYVPESLNISSIVHALCASGRFAEAHHRLLLFVASGCVPDERTCNVLIARLLDGKLPESTLEVVRGLLDRNPNFVPSLVAYNRLMHRFCNGRFGLSSSLSLRRTQLAHGLFLDMVSRGHCPNAVCYTTLIQGYCKAGDLTSAYKVFDEMRGRGVLPNSLTYSMLVCGLLRKRDVEGARELMGRELWKQMEVEEDMTVKIAAFGNLINSLCREGFFQEVFRIAEDMPQKKAGIDDKSAYEQMIDSLCMSGRWRGAERIVYIMRKRGCTPNSLLLSSIVQGLCKEKGGCMRAYQLLCESKSACSFVPSEVAFMILVEELCREHDLDKAREVLRVMLKIKEGVNGTRTYNIYLRALCLMNNPTELLNVLIYMLQAQCQPDMFTLNTVINGLCKNERVDDALKVLNDMIAGKFCAPDVVTFTTVICGLMRVGRTDESLDLLFSRMPERGLQPTLATYNGLLRGLLKLNLVSKALEIFKTMGTNGVTADSTTHAIMIQGFCDLNQVEEAKRFWDEVVWPSKTHDFYVYSAILKGLCRSDKFNEACDFLYELRDCGVALNIWNYNIVINSACRLGLRREAYQILAEMRKNGLAPDGVTWRILNKLHRDAKEATRS